MCLILQGMVYVRGLQNRTKLKAMSALEGKCRENLQRAIKIKNSVTTQVRPLGGESNTQIKKESGDCHSCSLSKATTNERGCFKRSGGVEGGGKGAFVVMDTEATYELVLDLSCCCCCCPSPGFVGGGGGDGANGFASEWEEQRLLWEEWLRMMRSRSWMLLRRMSSIETFLLQGGIQDDREGGFTR